jgi:acetolactate synthase-1/2/3 large subunit
VDSGRLMNVIGEIYGKTMSINRDEDITKAVEFVTEPGLKLLKLRICPDDFPPMNIEAALRF